VFSKSTKTGNVLSKTDYVLVLSVNSLKLAADSDAEKTLKTLKRQEGKGAGNGAAAAKEEQSFEGRSQERIQHEIGLVSSG
jgi:hypothetical protein